MADVPVPEPGPRQVLVKVAACGVCRTDLHVVDGDLRHPKLPLVPGHEIAGVVEETGKEVRGLKRGDMVGIPWLGSTRGECRFCRKGSENLCESPGFTGYTIDGGYAEYAAADERYCFRLPAGYTFTEAAPLLCAGLIGYRSYVMAGEAEHLGIYGFGAAAHIITQVAVSRGRVRGHSHEPDPRIPLRAPLGGTGAPVRGEPHEEGRGGVPGGRCRLTHTDGGDRLSAL
jgi:propanol-preferring alcohol dehydrogenase